MGPDDPESTPADRSSDSVGRLREAARSDDPETRAAAVESLADTKPDASESVLADAVLDPSRDVQLTAVQAVGRNEIESALSALATVLDRETDPELRAATARTLGKIGNEDTVPPLVDALEDGPVEPICSALEEIDHVSNEGTASLLLDRLDDAVTAGDDRIASALVKLIRRVDTGPAIRTVRDRQRSDETLALRIGRLDHYDRIVDEHGLVSPAAFASPDPVLRCDAADEAGRALLPDDSDSEAIDVNLGDEPVASDTEIDADEVVERLLACLEDDDLKVRCEAAASMLAVRDRRAVGPICRTLDRAMDEGSERVESIQVTLSLFWPGRQVELFVHHLKSSDDGAGIAGGVLVWWICSRVDLPIPSQRAKLWLAGRQARKALFDADPGDRDPNDVAVLAITGSEKDVPLLLDALKDPDALVRAQAAFALGHLGCSLHRLTIESASVRARFTIEDIHGVSDDRVPPALLGALQEETDPVAIARLADALGMYAESEAVDPLLSILDRPEPLCRETTAAALGRIGDDRAVDSLCELLREDDVEVVRGAAAAGLGAINDDRAVDVLDTALQTDPSDHVRECAAGALGQFEDHRADQSLAEAAHIDEASDVRQTARLAGIPTPFSGTALEPAARTFRRKTLSSLGFLHSIGWAVYLPLRQVGAGAWTGLRPMVSYLLDVILGWLVILAFLLLIAMLVAGVGTL